MPIPLPSSSLYCRCRRRCLLHSHCNRGKAYEKYKQIKSKERRTKAKRSKEEKKKKKCRTRNGGENKIDKIKLNIIMNARWAERRERVRWGGERGKIRTPPLHGFGLLFSYVPAASIQLYFVSASFRCTAPPTALMTTDSLHATVTVADSIHSPLCLFSCNNWMYSTLLVAILPSNCEYNMIWREKKRNRQPLVPHNKKQ